MESIVKKIAKVKGIGYILIAVAAAVIFLLLPSSNGSSGGKSENSGDAAVISAKDAEEYISILERKTEELLNRINGISDCKVMLIADSGYTGSYAADQTVQRSFDGSGKTMSESEQKKYVTVSSGGSVSLVRTKESFPKICGIAVICPDSGDSARLAVTETLKALYNLSSNRISVQK
ncbi:MAG: hypothetical protein IJS94_08130 [Clostridia bacterium]|nr:hypothetical protein [Clostridia bacterium]